MEDLYLPLHLSLLQETYVTDLLSSCSPVQEESWRILTSLNSPICSQRRYEPISQSKSCNIFWASSNFYWRLIGGLSIRASPLPALLRKETKQWQWTNQVFTRLKEVFTSAPIWKLPNPSRTFIMEACASETGVSWRNSQAPHSGLHFKEGKLQLVNLALNTGVTGWRDLIVSWFTQITTIWSTSSQLRDWAPIGHAGPCWLSHTCSYTLSCVFINRGVRTSQILLCSVSQQGQRQGHWQANSMGSHIPCNRMPQHSQTHLVGKYW